VKTLKHKTKTHHLLLRIDDPKFWGLTGRKLQCFILTASNDGIEIAKTCARPSTLYKVFRYDDDTKLLALLGKSEADKEELSQFIKANRWINEYASSSLRKLLALWLLAYDSR